MSDPTVRVAERVRRRRRLRLVRRWIGITAVGVVIVLGVSLARARSSQRVDVATSPPVAVVRVEVLGEGALTIRFPGRATSGQPPRVELPRGVIRFEVKSLGGTETIVVDGVPKFVATVTPPVHGTVTQTVRIAPGTYLMHSAIPGHTEAGEEAVLIVK
ncbi:MAG TPA: hypothetical protein VHV78_09590 [Gemmatimonadaceae bacterium]|nr:hypothetical protein [Gemmatimonadaceae bacterium]